MAVVINEFEMVPAPAKSDDRASVKREEKPAPNEPPTDHEVQRMIERRMERMERVAAH